MIRRHRNAHRVISLALLTLLPVLVVYGLAGRKPLLAPAELPDQVRTQVVAPQMALRFASDSLWPSLPITSYLFSDSDSYVLFLSLEGVIPFPDVLVYWSEAQPGETDSPDSRAVLLGALSAASVTRFELAPAMLESEGTLFLYSLGHRRQIGSVELPFIFQTGEDSGS